MLHITRQGQSTQEVGQVVSQGKQLQPRLVVVERAAGELRPFHGILAFLNPLFCGAATIVKLDHVQPTGEKFPDPDRPGKMIDQLKPVIPERYNSSSELKVDVSASEENQFEFALLTEP